MTIRERRDFIKASGRIAGSTTRMNGRNVEEAYENFCRFPALAKLALGTSADDKRDFTLGYIDGRHELTKLEMYKTNARMERDRILAEAKFES